ncbi:M20 family metallopeptidase [Streptomyces virginiae]|uniref:M20 family metallopeptidase n=1 Tax=Streptomyces virginiae TaxID=1961 RepID=UPI0030DF911D
MLDSVELLKQMIAIRSVNPLLPGSTAEDDEQELGHYIANYLQTAGIEVELQQVKDGRCNIIGHVERSGRADDAIILLTGHMDTYPANGPRSGYQPIQEGRDLYGRGSADAKGSLASMLTAFCAAAQSPHRREAYIAATIDEECLLLGAQQLTLHGMRPTLGITGEPTNLIPIVAQKGIIRGAFKVNGNGIHAAYPKQGSAIVSAAHLISAVESLNESYARTPGSSTLGHPSITVTKMKSSGGMNLVAREVAVWFDARFLPGTTGEDFARKIEDELREILPEGVDFVMDPLTFISPANDAPLTIPVMTDLFSAITSVTGTCEPDRFSYGSEAGVLAQICEASIVLGPGDARYSHGKEEMISIDQVESAVEIFRRILVGE